MEYCQVTGKNIQSKLFYLDLNKLSYKAREMRRVSPFAYEFDEEKFLLELFKTTLGIESGKI